MSAVHASDARSQARPLQRSSASPGMTEARTDLNARKSRARSSRKANSIPAFDYQRSAHHDYLGFKPETNPARRADPEAQEKYLYSAHLERDTWFRVANERMLAQQYREQGTPFVHQVRDVLTYIPFTVGVE